MRWSLVYATILILFNAATGHCALTIGGFDLTRGGFTSLRDADQLQHVRDSIQSAFPGAVFTATNTLTEEYLGAVDAILISSVYAGQQATTALSSQEQDALLSFVKSGGGALLATDIDCFDPNAPQVNNSFISPFGLHTKGMLKEWQFLTSTDANHFVTNGTFGTVSVARGWYAGYFDDLGPYAVPLGEYDGFIGLAAIDPGVLSPTSGGVVFISDRGTVFGNVPECDNTTLLLNAVAFITIPEPSTFVVFTGLFALGLLPLAWRRYRKT